VRSRGAVIVVGREWEKPEIAEEWDAVLAMKMDDERACVSCAALNRMISEDEVGMAVMATSGSPGECTADIDRSAGIVAR
jgi:hypothetical protein